VYDGGGILPDILTEKETFSPLATSLGRNRLFFDYAIKYHFEHPSIKPAKEFHLTDNEYAAFVKWLSDKEYDYTTQVERDLNDLEASAKKEKSLEIIDDQLKALKSKLSHNKDNDLQISKAEIKLILEEEIIKHYYLEKGMREASFNEDKEVKAALELFKDSNRYKEILAGKKN
jgi:carboxyl-terminal processing protease